MAYLHRRIEHLLKLFREGKLYFSHDAEKEEVRFLIEDIRKIKRKQKGEIDLSTCSSRARSFAKVLYLIEELRTKEKIAPIESSSKDPVSDIYKIQNEFFDIIDDFFKRATGKDVKDFATPETFGKEIRRNAHKLARLMNNAFSKGIDNLMKYYSKYKANAYSLCRQLGGIKLIVGGSQRLFSPTLQSVKSMLLYADTILIPDPVLPWIEIAREEERFRHIHMLEAIFLLLHLKPIIKAELPYPATVVFPSWEKSLESQDLYTKEAFESLMMRFFSYYLEIDFEDETEIFNYAHSQEEKFLEFVERKRLFIAPGGRLNESIKEQIRRYCGSILTWRSQGFIKWANKLNNAELVLNGILERLNPQLHLRDNSESLNSQPMLCNLATWHYFRLCAEMYNEILLKSNILSKETIAIIHAINRPEFFWLGNIPFCQLVNLRKENVNLEFRRRLDVYTRHLNETALGDLDQVAADVARGINSLLVDHQRKIQEIKDKYRNRNLDTVIMSGITLAAIFLPWLAPYFGLIAPVTIASKYAKDKIEERKKKRKAEHSLTGVLAAAHEKDDQ